LINRGLTFTSSLGIVSAKYGCTNLNCILSFLNLPTMLYLIAIILIIGWLLGFFVFSAGGLIHVLLVIAIIAIILRLIRGDRAL
jgi:Family of unknown function (DUF5670)